MIYVKVIFPDDQFTMFSALRVTLDSDTRGGHQRFATFQLPHGEGTTESYDRYDVLSIYLMSETGKTLHKICGMVAHDAAKEAAVEIHGTIPPEHQMPVGNATIPQPTTI